MAIDTVVGTFENNSERILWLPSITLVYLFTLSGDAFQFVTGVAAIGGAQWFRLLMNSDFTSGQRVQAPRKWFRENYSYSKIMLLAGLSMIYAAATIYALWKLYHHFTHQDLVLVGLGAVWCGIAMVVLVNMTAAAANNGSG